MRPAIYWCAPFVGAAVVSLLVAVPAGATPITVGTFADPSSGAAELFTFDFVNGQVFAGWSGGHAMDLKVRGTLYPGVQFDMHAPGSQQPMQIASYTDPANLLKGGTTGPGEIDFFLPSAPSNPLFSITFSQARFSVGLFGAREPAGQNNITFSGSALGTTLFTDEVFSFSFANQAVVRDGQNLPLQYTTTASFTSSGSEIPEPATITLFSSVVLAGMMGRRRRR